MFVDRNPHVELPAHYCAHSSGRTKVVRVLRLITEKSVEEAMYARARYRLDDMFVDHTNNKSTPKEQEEFLVSSHVALVLQPPLP